MKIESVYEFYLKGILNGDKNSCHRTISEALESGIHVIDLYQNVFYPVMVKTGELWAENRISVAQEHLITAITQNIISSLYPRLLGQLKERNQVKGKILMACPGDELHELGSRMLSDIWELDGWDVTYLGANIPGAFIAGQLKEQEYNILSLSCTLSFNVRFVKDTISLVREEKEFKGPVIVGGRIFNVDPSLKDYVDADYHGVDYYHAKELLAGMNL